MKKILISLAVAALLISYFPISPTLANGNPSSESGKVKVITEDGDVLYLDTQLVESETKSENKSNFLMSDGVEVPNGFFQDIGELINKALTFIIAISALMVFLYLIWGGIDWITSGGDKAKTDQARQKIISAVIGLILVAASFAILTIVLNFLGIKSLQDALDQAVNSDISVVKTSNNTDQSLGDL